MIELGLAVIIWTAVGLYCRIYRERGELNG